jgi:GTP-binding protein
MTYGSMYAKKNSFPICALRVTVVPNILMCPKTMGLDDALEYIDESELVEVTPKSIRIRKIILNEVQEKRRKRELVH